MAWRFTGRARVDANHPEAFGICDRCGFLYNLVDLKYQFEWRGPRLVNIRLRVCSRCLDKPFIFNKPIIYPPDPVPVADPRPESFAYINQGSDPLPPLPWPIAPLGPVDPSSPFPPPYPTDVFAVGEAAMGDPDPPLLDPPALAQVPPFPQPNVPPPPVIPPTIEDILVAEP